MSRSATFVVAALVGLLLAGCGGGFGQTGVSLPRGGGDEVQTVADAADALDAHRSSASDNAKAAIGATDALGSFVRDIGYAERTLNGSPGRRGKATRERRIVSGSTLVLQARYGNVTQFCESSAGYGSAGIPSLDVSFGWRSGAFSGGTRTSDEHGLATWSANASGEIVQGGIGALSLKRGAGAAMCPMRAPAFRLGGADASNAFSIPVSIVFHRGQLVNVSVASGAFANGESLDVTTVATRQMPGRQNVEVDGTIRNGGTKLATFRTNELGNGTLAITSTGAQYVISDWIVAGT